MSKGRVSVCECVCKSARDAAESTLRVLLNSFSCCSHIHFVFSSFFSVLSFSVFEIACSFRGTSGQRGEQYMMCLRVLYVYVGIASINRIECLRAKQREAGNEQNVEKTTLHSLSRCFFAPFTFYSAPNRHHDHFLYFRLYGHGAHTQHIHRLTNKSIQMDIHTSNAHIFDGFNDCEKRNISGTRALDQGKLANEVFCSCAFWLLHLPNPNIYFHGISRILVWVKIMPIHLEVSRVTQDLLIFSQF